MISTEDWTVAAREERVSFSRLEATTGSYSEEEEGEEARIMVRCKSITTGGKNRMSKR